MPVDEHPGVPSGRNASGLATEGEVTAVDAANDIVQLVLLQYSSHVGLLLLWGGHVHN